MPPWGPDDFHAFAVHQTTPIPPVVAFMTAVGFLAGQVSLPFTGRVSRGQSTFRDPSLSPRLSIIVGGPRGADQRVLRAHVFWGVAQILNHMIGGHGFTAGTWQLSSGGVEVGTIFFVAGGDAVQRRVGAGSENSTIGGALSQPIPLSELNPASTTALSDSVFFFQFQFVGDLMTMESVFMGAIAALVELAPKPEATTFDDFRASFPGYRAFWVWRSVRRSEEESRLKKEVLVLGVGVAVRFAMSNQDWRALRVTVFANGERPGLVGLGGYAADSEGPIGVVASE
ncbi:MAG: hypothetical protein Q9208_004450 [Pyrenodesmia sp. 3 TL-2023]